MGNRLDSRPHERESWRHQSRRGKKGKGDEKKIDTEKKKRRRVTTRGPSFT